MDAYRHLVGLTNIPRGPRGHPIASVKNFMGCFLLFVGGENADVFTYVPYFGYV